MIAEPGALPADAEDDAWAYEILWQGARVLISSSGGRARVATSDVFDIGPHIPEVRAIGGALGTTEVILDGVVTAPDRETLDRRLTASDMKVSVVRRLSRTHPARLMLFDVLWLEGHSTTELPYRERRQLLAELALDDPAWSVPSYHVGDGAALLGAAHAQGLPGVVAKRLDSPHRSGQVSPDWRVVRG
jgi:bifunctional non-homologous end joining protein LigD